jgi:hypothetical protein
LKKSAEKSEKELRECRRDRLSICRSFKSRKKKKRKRKKKRRNGN